MSTSTSHSTVATNYFAYLGGLFVLAGIGVYLGTFWEELGVTARILTTAGTGFALYLLAVLFSKSSLYAKAVTPLILVAAPLQCSGLYVATEELHLNWAYQDTSILILAVMAFQYLATFWSIRRTATLLAALFFGVSFLGTWLDRLEMDPEMISFLLGFLLLCVSYAVSQTSHRAISGLTYFFGSGMFFFGSFELIDDAGIDLAFLGLSCIMILVATLVKSRPLLSSSCIALLSYVSYYTNLHFVNSLSWPIGLMVLGFFFLGWSAFSIRCSEKHSHLRNNTARRSLQ